MARQGSTLRRLCATAGVLATVGAAAAMGGSGPAQAAQPLVIGSCQATVEGTPGQPIALSSASIVDPVLSVLQSIPLVGPTLSGPVGQAVGAMSPIPLGEVPSGGGYISGAQIATAATNALHTLPVLAPVMDTVLTGVRPVLTNGCGITVHVVNSAAAPVQDGANALLGSGPKAPGQPANPPAAGPGGGTPSGPAPGQRPAPEQPASPGAPGLSAGSQAVGGLPLDNLQGLGLYQPGTIGTGHYGRVPLYDYTGLAFATPGEFVPSPALLDGEEVTGYAPELGILAAPNGTTSNPRTTNPRTGGVRSAEAVQPLVSLATGRAAMPVALAALALATVTAALVRSWARRRTA